MGTIDKSNGESMKHGINELTNHHLYKKFHNTHFKVNKKTGCWEWIRATDGQKGYGRYREYLGNYKGKTWPAHRYFWTLANGDISDGLMVCHKCDNPPCVNPEHLFLGTGSDNMKDMWDKNRHPTRKILDSDLPKIINLKSEGMSFSQIAELFDCTPSAVFYALKRLLDLPSDKFRDSPLICEEFNDILLVLELGARKYGSDNWLDSSGVKSSFADMHHSMFHHLSESWSQGFFDTRGDAESDLDPLLHLAVRALMTYTKLKRGLF